MHSQRPGIDCRCHRYDPSTRYRHSCVFVGEPEMERFRGIGLEGDGLHAADGRQMRHYSGIPSSVKLTHNSCSAGRPTWS
jgi:hypothetical protein